jgi:hypothetical protein
VGVLTNHEGWYVGDVRFDALWGEVERWAGEERDRRGVVFVHPTEPVVRLGEGRIAVSRPCKFCSISRDVLRDPRTGRDG